MNMFSSYTGIDYVYILVTVVLSLSIHEAMHAYAAHALGDTTAQDMGRLSLNPLKHIDPYTTVLLPIVTLLIFHVPFLAAKPVPFNPARVKYGEFGGAIIAAAGPLSNLAMALIAVLILRYLDVSGGVYNFLDIFLTWNVAIFVFNILPIPPLDGSRVLYAFAPEPVQDFMQTIEPYGFFIIIALVLTGALSTVIIDLNNFFINLLVRV
jgi:Zn-dependent protease